MSAAQGNTQNDEHHGGGDSAGLIQGQASRIEELFKKLREENRIGVMTHIVFGYPTVEASRQFVDVMVRAGVDLIEIQLPFSDPTADGPTITHACQKALDRGVRVADGMAFMEEMTRTYPIPFLFMSYYNIVFNYHTSAESPRGVIPFVQAAATAGTAGLIVPDIPPEEVQEGYPEACREFGLHPIYVLSPNIDNQRLEVIKNVASGFLYCTSRTGTTGKNVELQLDQLGRFLDRVHEIVNLPLAVGFSISRRDQIEALQPRAEMAVIGSHLIRVFDELGLAGFERELRNLTGRA